MIEFKTVLATFIGAVLGMIVDFIFKVFLENFIKFYFKNCDAVLMMSNITKENALEMFDNKASIKPLRIGNELYWGIDFEDNLQLLVEDLLGDSEGFLYITYKGNKKLKK